MEKSTVFFRSSVMPIAATPTSNWLLATAASRPEKSWPVNTTLSTPARCATFLNSSTSKPVKLPEASVKVYGFESPTLATRMVPGSMVPSCGAADPPADPAGAAVESLPHAAVAQQGQGEGSGCHSAEHGALVHGLCQS